MGKISDSKMRFSLSIDKQLKTQLEQLAEQDGRSLTNLIVKILQDYVDKKS